MNRQPRSRLLLCGALLLAMALFATSSLAQSQNNQPIPDGSFLRFGCGDINVRGGASMSLFSKLYRAILFVPDFGWTGDLFLAQHDLTPGWTARAGDNQFNAFCFTAVGTGLADPVPKPMQDLAIMSEKNIEATYQLCMASHAQFVFAHGLGAAFALKARSLDAKACEVLVLIDPVSPQDIGTKPEMSYAEAHALGQDLEDRLWVEWGVGPKPGVEYEDSEIGAAGFQRLLERYEPGQPPYWVSASTGFDGKLVVGSGQLLRGLSVLMVGTPHRGVEQRKREQELTAWLEAHGVWVQQFELAELGLPGMSRLPMVGDHADVVFDAILERARLLLPVSSN